MGFLAFCQKFLWSLNLLGGLGLRNLICKHPVLYNKNIQFRSSYLLRFSVLCRNVALFSVVTTQQIWQKVYLCIEYHIGSMIGKNEKQAKKWLDFVRHKRNQWNPSCGSVVCTVHFTEDSFEHGSDTVERYKTLKLERDEIGITAVPSK